MLIYTTGNIFESEAIALVNTVNCEGYMGKGLAFQFKNRFPKNNIAYVEVCKKGELRPGNLFLFEENGKLIVNFPTKDKWRLKSKMEYISSGLDALIVEIEKQNIKSIAIPPLGSGNGGLDWREVKEIINKKLTDIADKLDIYIYEPATDVSKNNQLKPVKLGLTALVMMRIKDQLTPFKGLRLNAAVALLNIEYGKEYISLSAKKKNSTENLSNEIKAYQKYHKTNDNKKLQEMLFNVITSKKNNKLLKDLEPIIQNAATVINAFRKNKELEILLSLCQLLQDGSVIEKSAICNKLSEKIDNKGNKYLEKEIESVITKLLANGYIDETLLGIELHKF